jgi:hypothetical protein
MAKAYMCDGCKKLITENDIRIVLHGYSVHHNIANEDMPKGYGIGIPEEFCSFKCLANWADEQQKLLDDYEALCLKRAEKIGKIVAKYAEKGKKHDY